MQFLKRHYEKIILCVVLLGLGAAVIWMGQAIAQIQTDTPEPPPQGKGKPIAPLDLSTDKLAMAEVANSPPVVLSGDHNLFNPVTWRRKPNGELMKILRTGADALVVTNVTPLYTVIAYDHPSPNGGVYIFNVQEHSGRKTAEYASKDKKTKSGLYIVRGIKGAVDSPDAIDLEIPETQEHVWVTQDKPYKTIDGYTADLVYPPESRMFARQRVNDTLTLDNEQYKIIEITNDLVRVQSINSTKVTTIKVNRNP